MRPSRHTILGMVALLAWFLMPAVASAQARHERVTVSPIKQKGQTVGARIKVTLRPEHGRTSGRLVLGRVEPSKWGPGSYRQAATDPQKGYLAHQFDRFNDVKAPTEQTYEIRYGKGNTLKPGDKVDLTSVWEGSSAVHVWGMTRSGVTSQPIELPK